MARIPLQVQSAQTDVSKVTIRQYALEASNGDLTQLMTQMIQTNRAYEAAQRVGSEPGQPAGSVNKFAGKILGLGGKNVILFWRFI